MNLVASENGLARRLKLKGRRKGRAKAKAIEMQAAGKRCQSESSPCLSI